MKVIIFYIKILSIKLFGTKEEKDDIEKMTNHYDNITKDYTIKNKIKNKRKAEKKMIKELEEYIKSFK